MGQAFDRDGRVLGEATGDTKREVFDQLMKEHPMAHEIRIKSLKERLEAENAPQTPMPRYQSHKKVWALHIESVRLGADVAKDETREPGSAVLVPSEYPFRPFTVDAAYVRKHNPTAGGYYVQYEDGYKSFSPAAAFESGYTRI